MRRSPMRSQKTSRLCVSSALVAIALIVAPTVTSAQTLIRDSEIEGMLKTYSDPIFTAAQLNPDDVRIRLIADKSINAFVTDGQQVFLHTGLILKAETPNQLKGVIAHETGHISGGHLARSTQAIKDAMRPAYVTIVLGLLAIAAGAGEAGSALIASSQQFALLNFLQYSQVQESSADQAAVSFLDKTGQSSLGLVAFFQGFAYNEVMSEARKDPFFRSHPLSNNRIAALERRALASPYKDTKDTDNDISAFALMHAKLKGFLEPPQRTLLTYANDNTIPGRYARAIAQYRTPDMTSALATIRALIVDQPTNAYFWELEGQMLYENGRITESLAPYRRSHELAPKEALIAVSFARALAESEDKIAMEEAIPILRVALVEEPDNAFAWRTLATIHDRKGQKGLARLAAAEEAFWLGDPLRAQQFGQVARDLLPVGTPERRRAEDIVLVTEVAAIRQQRRGPSPRFSINGASLVDLGASR